MDTQDLTYYVDVMRHLVCVPYSVPNLHRMAEDLGIKRCWFDARQKRYHYDVPKRRVEEIWNSERVNSVSTKVVHRIIEEKIQNPELL